MPVPLLQDLAVEEIAFFISQGKYDVPSKPIGPILSNKIFEKLCKIIGLPNMEIIEKLMGKIMPSEVDLSYFDMQEWIFPYLNELNLKSLKLGDYSKMTSYCDAPEDQNLHYLNTIEDPECYSFLMKKFESRTGSNDGSYVNIVKLLEDILNPYSRILLECLELTSYTRIPKFQFVENWVRKVGNLLPNLKVLKLSQIKISPKDLSNIFCFFPNLVDLDISSTGTKILEGISKLFDLKRLSIGYNPIENKKAFMDLFNLKNLEYLSLSEANKGKSKYFRHLIKLFASSDRELPELRYLDCMDTTMNNKMLKKIVKRNPELKIIAANYSNVTLREFPGITLYINNSFNLELTSLVHFRHQKNQNAICSILSNANSESFINTRRRQINYWEQNRDMLLSFLKELVEILNFFDVDSQIMDHVFDCCQDILKQITTFEEAENELLIEILLKLNAFWRIPNIDKRNSEFEESWQYIKKLLNSSPNFNIDKVCAEAMKVISHCDMPEFWTVCALKVLGGSLDKIDINSKYYKRVEMGKMCTVLRKLLWSRMFFNSEKEVAVEVMRFVQLNFLRSSLENRYLFYIITFHPVLTVLMFTVCSWFLLWLCFNLKRRIPNEIQEDNFEEDYEFDELIRKLINA